MKKVLIIATIILLFFAFRYVMADLSLSLRFGILALFTFYGYAVRIEWEEIKEE